MTVSVSWLELVPPACAVATFVTEPLFRSACVIVYDAVQVIDSPGSRVPLRLPTVVTAGQVTVALSSVTVTGPASGTLPLFVTR